MADLKTRIGKLEQRAGVSSDVDAEVKKFLHDLTDGELARLHDAVERHAPQAELETLLSEVYEAREKRLKG